MSMKNDTLDFNTLLDKLFSYFSNMSQYRVIIHVIPNLPLTAKEMGTLIEEGSQNYM